MNKYVPEYEVLSEDLAKRMEREEADGSYQSYAFREGGAVRRDNDKDKGTLLRPAFARDIDKILHCPYYNRYADKTQVFSFYKNDDITRRALHVQLVSRIARNIGRQCLCLGTGWSSGARPWPYALWTCRGTDTGRDPF